MMPYNDAGRSVYDIAHFLPDPFPSSTYLEYLNTPEFQSAIGSPVNYTQSNQQVIAAFTATGDYERQALIPHIAALLNDGVRVGFMYGDRDYICNWLGGEAISLAVAAQTSATYASLFPAAGYAPIIVNTTYIGGVVRQFQVFARIITGTSLSTGAAIDLSTYNTTGPLNATHTNSLPASPSATCWIRNIPETCDSDQKNMIINNDGVIINGILYDASSDWSSPGSTVTPIAAGGSSVTVTTTTEVLTGLFTATSTPTTTKKSFGVLSFRTNINFLVVPILGALASSFLF
jgi:hypothetical protein